MHETGRHPRRYRPRRSAIAGAPCRSLFAFLALTIAAGCFSGKAYEGAARPESSVSVVYGHNRIFGSKILVAMVDGRQFYPMVTKVEILPGKHTIHTLYTVHTTDCPLTLTCDYGPLPVTAVLETEAGHKYQFESEGGRQSLIWIVDTTTGKKLWEQPVNMP